MNIHGERVQRTPREYPYSYDPFAVYKDPAFTDADECVYSDRIRQWDWEKFNRCCEAIWGNCGQYFHARKPDEIERFLRMYFDDESIKLTGIEECCNFGNGYPYWGFYMRRMKDV